MSIMPVLPIKQMVSDLSAEDSAIVCAAFTDRGVPNKHDGYARLRANKPYRRNSSAHEGCANYVWRMLCFDLVGSGKHACMPVCADFELWDACEELHGNRPRYGQPGYEDWQGKLKDLRVRMDALVDEVESKLPVEAKKGIIRWGRALGMIG